MLLLHSICHTITHYILHVRYITCVIYIYKHMIAHTLLLIYYSSYSIARLYRIVYSVWSPNRRIIVDEIR